MTFTTFLQVWHIGLMLVLIAVHHEGKTNDIILIATITILSAINLIGR